MGVTLVLSRLPFLLRIITGLPRILFHLLVGVIRAFLPWKYIPHKDVSGQTVLITGAASGVGRLLAVKFASLGCRLVLWDLNAEENKKTARMCVQEGVEASTYTIDITDKEMVAETAQKVLERYGFVDILINNAGIVTGKKLLDCSNEVFEKTMSVNANALFYVTKQFLPAMIERGKGHVVVVSSMAGRIGINGLVDYSTSKFAACGFAESLHAELATLNKNIKTTLICPYYMNTGMFDEPEYVRDQIVEAVLTDTHVVYMPKFCYVSLLMKELFSVDTGDAIIEECGVHLQMENFKGRQ